MQIATANPNYSCSTLILGNVSADMYGLPRDSTDIDQFTRRLIEAITEWDSRISSEIRGSYQYCFPDEKYLPQPEKHDIVRRRMNRWLVKDYAFLFVSTSHKQIWAEYCLEELGFQKTRRVRKLKNEDEEITLWIMPIEDLLKKLNY